MTDRVLTDDGYTAALGSAYVTATADAVIDSIDPTSGTTDGGTAVTVSGSGFTGATGLLVGGVAATSVVVVDNQTITADTPAGTAGAKNVIVQHPGGNATLVDGFTYT